MDLYWAASDSCRFCYVERWNSEDELRAMLRSRHFSQLIALTELALEFIGCEFKIISETRGLGFAADVQGEAKFPHHLAETGRRKNV